MSKQQVAYIAAKAAYETARDAARRMVGPVPDTLTDEELEAFCGREIAAENHYNVWGLLKMMRAAESDLFAWAKSKLAEHPQYAAHKEDLDKVFGTNLISIREKTIDACLRLAA